MSTEPYWQPLFDLMSDEHHLTLIESEMQDIAAAVDECRRGMTHRIEHGRTCDKVPHKEGETGYLHAADDDGPYDVDGWDYCGRCHHVLDKVPQVSRSMQFTDSDKAQVLDVLLDVLHKGGIIRGRKAKLVWVDGQPTLRPIVVEGPRKRKKEEEPT